MHQHAESERPVRRAESDQAVTWMNPGQVLRGHRTTQVRPNGAWNQSPDYKRFPLIFAPTIACCHERRYMLPVSRWNFSLSVCLGFGHVLSVESRQDVSPWPWKIHISTDIPLAHLLSLPCTHRNPYGCNPLQPTRRRGREAPDAARPAEVACQKSQCPGTSARCPVREERLGR
jgi:hypothetical protein